MESWLPLAVGGGAVALLAGAYALVRGMRNSKTNVVNTDGHEKDVVYLFQFPRCVRGPNASPFCIKIEMFLRMHNIPHKVVGTRRNGPKNKMPYIAYNGQVISDSDFVVEFLMKEFDIDCDKSLDAAQRGIGHATAQMIEENLYWSLVHYRWVQAIDQLPELLSPKPSFIFRLLIRYVASPGVAKQCHAQGMGRHSVAEINHIAEADMRSVAGILGDKPFLLGDTPTSHDATVFAFFSVLLYQMEGSPAHTLITTELPNIVNYCQRMRDRWFADWEDVGA